MEKIKYKSIVVDIDNTLTELQYTIDKIAKVYERELITEEEVFDFNLKKVIGITDKEDKSFWDIHEKDIVENVPYSKGRVEKVLEYLDKDYLEEVYLVSNRPLNLRESTLRWLEEHGIEYTTLELIGDKYKEEVVRDRYSKVDAIFEDNPKVVHGIKKQPQTKHIDTWLVDYPYNRTTTADYIICNISGEVTDNDGKIIGGNTCNKE